MRPPHRSRASRTVTLLPARASSRAAIRPAAPAPTIRTWVGCRRGIGPSESGVASRGCAIRAAAGSVSLPGGNELEIVHRHLLEERLVLALRERPEDRRGLLAGVPVLAAADPDGPGEGGAEAGEEF